MDAPKSDPNATDVEAGNAKTNDQLIQKLRKAEESVVKRLNSRLEESGRIHKEISKYRYQSQIVRRKIGGLRNQITSLEQFLESMTTKEELAEKTRKLKYRFHHNTKNLAAERATGREIREIAFTEKAVIKDRERSNVESVAYEKIREIVKLGEGLNEELDVGIRAELKRVRQFDSMQDLKRGIDELKFGMYRADRSVEKGCATVEILKKKLVEVEKHLGGMEGERIKLGRLIREAEGGGETKPPKPHRQSSSLIALFHNWGDI